MSPIRFRDEEPSLGGVIASLAIGALAGFAVGMVVAQKGGGLSGIMRGVRRRFSVPDHERDEHERYHREDLEYGDDELDEDEEAYSVEAALEDEVLEAFQSDPILSERAIDIGAIRDGVIELSGWVESDDEVQHATDVARRVTRVESVVNRLAVGNEDEFDAVALDTTDEDTLKDPNKPIPGGRWEGQRVGTGRRRQGRSDENDRHVDPKVELEDRWLDEQHAIHEAAGDIEGIAERRRRSKKPVEGDQTRGSRSSPSRAPKTDPDANPDEAPQN